MGNDEDPTAFDAVGEVRDEDRPGGCDDVRGYGVELGFDGGPAEGTEEGGKEEGERLDGYVAEKEPECHEGVRDVAKAARDIVDCGGFGGGFFVFALDTGSGDLALAGREEVAAGGGAGEEEVAADGKEDCDLWDVSDGEGQGQDTHNAFEKKDVAPSVHFHA